VPMPTSRCRSRSNRHAPRERFNPDIERSAHGQFQF
jgi:hypothetical protein